MFNKMTMQMKMNSQQGFALLPIIIIAVAALVLIGGGGAAVYQIQRSNEAEKSALRQEIESLREEEPTLEPEESSEEDMGKNDEEMESSPIASPVSPKTPKVKAATTVTPATNTATTSEPNIPLIVEQEFEKVYGRKPSNSESNTWKSKYRANDWSRSQLRSALDSTKQAAVIKQPTPSPVKQALTPSPTPTPTPAQRVTTFTPISVAPVDTVDPQEQLRQQQIAQKRAELTAQLNSIKQQLRQLRDRILEIDDIVEERERRGGGMEAIRRVTAPLIAEQNALIYQHDELVKKHNALVEQINLLNLL